MITKIKTIIAVTLLSSLANAQTVQESIQKLHANVQALEAIVNGPASGDGSQIVLPNGTTQDTVAKAITNITAEVQTARTTTTTTLSTLNTAIYSDGDSVILADGRGYKYSPNATAGDVIAEGGGYWVEAMPSTSGNGFLYASQSGAVGDGVVDDTAALQKMLDDAGANGKIAVFDASPSFYKITDTLHINYPGQIVQGGFFNNESNSRGRIVQTTVGKSGFKINIPPGQPSTHNIIFRNLRIVGAGGINSVGIDFAVGPIRGNNFSDFNTIRNLRIEGFETGIDLVKFSNSTIAESSLFNCDYLVKVGGNCNAVNFNGVQFNTPTISCIHVQGSGYVSFVGCEAGNGPQLLTYDRSSDEVVAMTIDFYKLACESFSGGNIDVNSTKKYACEIRNNNIVRVHSSRWLAGSQVDTILFKYERFAGGRINNSTMSGFNHRVIADVTSSSLVQRHEDTVDTLGNDIVEVYRDNTFSTKLWSYAEQNDQIGLYITGALPNTEYFRGTEVVQYFDPISDTVYRKLMRQGQIQDIPILNTDLLNYTRRSSHTNMVTNTRYALSNTTGSTDFLLPSNSLDGDEIQVFSRRAGGRFRITQGASQKLILDGKSSTTGIAGSIESTSDYAVLTMKRIDTNTWLVINKIGTFVVN